MSKKIILVIALAVMSQPIYAPNNADAQNNQANSNATSSVFAAMAATGNRIGKSIQERFSAMEALAKNDELIAAVKNNDIAKLRTFADDFQSQLTDSLKVRLYTKGKEKMDDDTIPICGFACINMVRAAYTGKPDAEALLFHTPSANITLARGITDQQGETVGAIVAHYPYAPLIEEINQLTINGLFIELRQYLIVGASVALSERGDKSLKTDKTQGIIRIAGSKWAIAAWTRGGIPIEEYEPPAIPWWSAALAGAIVVLGVVVLLIRRRYQNKKQGKK